MTDAAGPPPVRTFTLTAHELWQYGRCPRQWWHERKRPPRALRRNQRPAPPPPARG